MTNDDKSFESAWFSTFNSHNMVERLNEIKTYAYLTFDELDKNKNGFIDQEELLAAYNSPKTNEREKSFIQFLLNNQQAIADSFDEGPWQDPEGISRQDIEAYFKIITSLLEIPPE